jgi:peptide/nickel transport system ATP-binding protein
MEPLDASIPRTTRTARARAMLTRVGLSDDLHSHKPAQLSGGQRQRVCIARALAGDSRLLILDEAVSALDVTIKREILNLLKELRHELSLSMLFVTHDMSVVKYIADDALVMYQGDLVESGPAQEILDNPVRPYTKRLISSVPRLRAAPPSSSAKS